MSDKQAILNALRKVQDPDLRRDIVSLGFVKEVKLCGPAAAVTIELTTPACPVKDLMQEQARQAILSLPRNRRGARHHDGAGPIVDGIAGSRASCPT